MLSLGTIAAKVFGTANDRKIKPLRPNVQKINALEDEVKAADAHSTLLRKPWQSYGMALTLLQIAISLASVTILTGRTWLFGGAGLAAAGGAGYWLLALANH